MYVCSILLFTLILKQLVTVKGFGSIGVCNASKQQCTCGEQQKAQENKGHLLKQWYCNLFLSDTVDEHEDNKTQLSPQKWSFSCLTRYMYTAQKQAQSQW